MRNIPFGGGNSGVMRIITRVVYYNVHSTYAVRNVLCLRRGHRRRVGGEKSANNTCIKNGPIYAVSSRAYWPRPLILISYCCRFVDARACSRIIYYNSRTRRTAISYYRKDAAAAPVSFLFFIILSFSRSVRTYLRTSVPRANWFAAAQIYFLIIPGR